MSNLFSAEFALKLDEKNPMKRIREKFNYPENSKSPVLYFSGNSLGLQPVSYTHLTLPTNREV